MKKVHAGLRSEFKVLLGNKRLQFAEMVLKPGATEGGPHNRHRGADQWLFVVSGRGVAIVNGTSHNLAKGTLLLIERGDNHEIRNTGRTPLKTLNAYSPPAYQNSNNVLPAGKP